ncbi:MAG: hypothetical protein D6788_03580 [Planctomycetota bacterium]|nr:MAG: hypothetical protein D6788_03580 [Planctomycetota bacterium]
MDESSPGRSAPPLADSLMAKQRTAVADVYRRFGERVREVLGKRITLVESPHFLIWTDWSARDRGRLPDWCEAMYAALCRQFGIDPTEPVFPAGCPLFCFESEKRFRRFAREFDGYGGLDAVGYTRSIPENGHVHVVLLRKGRTPEDFDRFACTLVHEGTHAFLHRLFTTRLIPHWVNEGIAEMMTERVLGDRCPAGEKADLLARQYARYDWPVGDWVRRAGPIEVHEYPLACSLVTFLEGQGTERFRAFVRDLKNGESLEAALARRYDGWSMETFLRRWREHVRRDGSPAKP